MSFVWIFGRSMVQSGCGMLFVMCVCVCVCVDGY